MYIYIGVWGLCVVLWTVPLNGKSASFRSCVRAKLCVCVREIMLLYAGLAILKFFSGVPFRSVPFRLWRVVFCMGFKETLKYSLIYAWVLCLLLIFSCVLHGFCHFVDIWLCIAWVLSCCWYLVVYSMGFIALLIFGCVLHGFYCFVDIWLCIAWVLSLCWYLVVYCMGFIALLIFGCV